MESAISGHQMAATGSRRRLPVLFAPPFTYVTTSTGAKWTRPGAPWGVVCMSDDTDFLALYEELALGARFDLVEFKRAYRKRVTQLHPDHQGGVGDMPRLQRLNRMYDAALDFHRLHGRLPGAAPARTPPPMPDSDPYPYEYERTEAPSHAQNIAGQVVLDDNPPVTGSLRRRRWLLVLVLAALLLYWWGAQKSANPSLDPAGPGDAVHPGLGAPVLAKDIVAGMDEQQVRRILGEPTGMHDGRWDYGPSWVQFQCGQVVGWYSSPLRRLPVDESTLASAAGAPHC